MASSTGPDSSTYQIPEVELGDTFNTWRDTTNTSIYKLNKMRVYEGISSSSTAIAVSSGGTLSVEIADNVAKGITFQNPIVFNSGVTFNGDVTFNATTFTVNATAVTIDDYAIVVGDTTGASDAAINTALGAGLLVNRGSGNTAEWLWRAFNPHGPTGVWRSNAHIGFVGTSFGIIPHAAGILPVHGSGLRIDGVTAGEHGLQFEFEGDTGENRRLEFVRYSPSGTTAFIEALSGSTYGTRVYTRIPDGVNKKVISQASVPQFGTPVRFDGTNYVAAQADSADNSEVVGIVSQVFSSTTFEITFIGEIFGDFSAVTDTGANLLDGRTYYLSPFAPGKITLIQPTTSGTVHKAVLVATGSKSAIVIPFTGGLLASPLNISNASSVATRIEQYNRFVKGDVVRFKAYSPGTTLSYNIGGGLTLEKYYPGGIYVKAQANTAEEAEMAGMVVEVSGTTGATPANTAFDVLMDGFFDMTGAITVTPGTVYFLNTSCAGTSGAFESATSSFNAAEPATEGSVRKPLFMATSSGGGYLYSYRGDVRGAAGGITYSDISQLLVQDIRSGITGDLKIGAYNGSAGGRQSITIAAGSGRFSNTVGSTAGYVGIGFGGSWSVWSGAAGNKIMAPLDLMGFMRLGNTLASTPAGQDLITIREGGTDAASGITVESRLVIGTDRSDANLVIGRNVRPSPNTVGFISSRAGTYDRAALTIGVSGADGPLFRWQTAINSNAALGAAVALNDVFRIAGNTAEFFGSVNIGTTFDRASTVTHKPRLFIQADSNTNPRPQIYMTGTDGNFLLFNASGQAGDYNPINGYDSGSYLVFGKQGGAGAGRTFGIAPWSSTLCGLLMSYNGTSVNVGINTNNPGATLDVVGTVRVGDFGGSTNVMVKPTLTAGVGQIVPLFAVSNGPPTPFLPTGTWFINITGHMNVNSGGPDENTVLRGSFVVTVPSGQYFSLAAYNTNTGTRNPATTAEQGRSGLVYRFFTSTTDQTTAITSSSTVPTGWTEFTESGTAPFKAKRYSAGSGIALSAPDASTGHSVVYQLDNTIGWVVILDGYAIRIA